MIRLSALCKLSEIHASGPNFMKWSIFHVGIEDTSVVGLLNFFYTQQYTYLFTSPCGCSAMLVTFTSKISQELRNNAKCRYIIH